MRRIIIVNFKTYKQSTGKNAIKLAKIHQKLAKKAKMIVAVQAADIANVSKSVKIDVLSQHMDSNELGAHTGSVVAESIKQNGARGTLLNHAEKRMKLNDIKEAIERCKKLGMYSVVCVPTIKQALAVAKFKPKYVAYEVPSLIGTGKPISRMRSRDVGIFAKEMNRWKIIPLCGAGISNGEDVRIALQLGCKGVLLASAVTTASNPRKILEDLVK